MKLVHACLCAFVLAACDGTTTLEDDEASAGTQTGSGQGGAAATGSGSAQNATASSAATSSVAATTGAGGGPCGQHEDCGPGALCIFSTGTCAVACEAGTCDNCSPGTVCDTCATSACPICAACAAACVPTPEGRCDDDDPCPEGSLCVFDYDGWQEHHCAPYCTDADPTGCSDPALICTGCVSGSCCGCKDCVSACVAPDG